MEEQQTNSQNTQSFSAPPPGSQGAPSPSGNTSPNTVMAILAYLGILIVVPFVTEAKNDPFVKFHIKQGLIIVIGWFALFIIGFIPGIRFIVPLLWVVLAVLDLIGLINAAQGKMKELPLVGGLGNSFKF